MESDQSHPEGKTRKNPSSVGQGQGQKHSLPSKATFQTIPGKRISIKKEQDKGEL